MKRLRRWLRSLWLGEHIPQHTCTYKVDFTDGKMTFSNFRVGVCPVCKKKKKDYSPEIPIRDILKDIHSVFDHVLYHSRLADPYLNCDLHVVIREAIHFVTLKYRLDDVRPVGSFHFGDNTAKFSFMAKDKHRKHPKRVYFDIKRPLPRRTPNHAGTPTSIYQSFTFTN